MKDFVENLKQTYSNIFVIVSPPRCSSTALSRVFWEHPTVSHYSHEPFETVYYQDKSLEDVFARIDGALDIRPLKRNGNGRSANALIIKEMPYQVGKHFELLASFATAPIVFLMRNPRLNIWSRMQKKIEVGDSPLFPHVETGWKLLKSHIATCRAANIPHVLIDSTDFRNHPSLIFNELFDQLGLTFSNDQLSWNPQSNVQIDNLDGQHTHLYKRVLQSDGLLIDDDPIPPMSAFPKEGGFLQHVNECLAIYNELSELDERIMLPDELDVEDELDLEAVV